MLPVPTSKIQSDLQPVWEESLQISEDCFLLFPFFFLQHKFIFIFFQFCYFLFPGIFFYNCLI